jgi:hypothetical protein
MDTLTKLRRIQQRYADDIKDKDRILSRATKEHWEAQKKSGKVPPEPALNWWLGRGYVLVKKIGVVSVLGKSRQAYQIANARNGSIKHVAEQSNKSFSFEIRKSGNEWEAIK